MCVIEDEVKCYCFLSVKVPNEDSLLINKP